MTSSRLSYCVGKALGASGFHRRAPELRSFICDDLFATSRSEEVAENIRVAGDLISINPNVALL